MRGDVAARVERPGVVHLARTHLLVLQVVGQGRRQIRGRLPEQGEPGGNGLLRIRIRFRAKVRCHRRRIVQVRLRLGHPRHTQQEVVVDEPGLVEPVDRAPERQPAGGERQVEGEAGVIPGRSAVLQREEVASNLEEPLAGIGTAWQVADRARQGAGAVERSLRSEQDFDPLDVLEAQIDRKWYVPQVAGDAVVPARARPVQSGGMQSAHDDHVAAARPLIDDGQPGRPAGKFGQVVDRTLLEGGAGRRRNAHRHLLR